MNDYDQCARFAVQKLRPIAFFRWLFGPAFTQAWLHDGWLETQSISFPRNPDRRCDTAARFTAVAMDEPPLAVVLEFMSVTRHATLRRMMQYVLQIQDDCLYQEKPTVHYSVIGAILNLTGGKQAKQYQSRPSSVGSYGIVGRFKVRTLKRESGERLLREIENGTHDRSLLVWAPLMRGAGDADYIRRWRAVLEGEADAEIRGNVVGLAKVFSVLSKRKEVWTEGLKDMDVQRSPVVVEWENRGIAIGKAEGVAIGKAEGVAIGEARGRRETLLQILTARFGVANLGLITGIIEQESDVERLKRWTTLAITCESVAAFQAGLS